MKFKSLLVLLTLSLGACANQSPSPNRSAYSLAVDTSSSSQPTKYVPVPVPGQLMPVKTSKHKALVGEAAIRAANKKAVRQPTSAEYINSIMTFNYMSGVLYQIYSAPLSVTDIQFQPGEHIVSVGAGDTLRWQVSKTFSGAGGIRQEHLLVKPIEEGLTNSLVITTDQRTYHLMLHSTAKTYMASVAWRYPDSTDGIIQDVNELPTDVPDLASNIDINRLDFNYQLAILKGSRPDWCPLMVFNDGSKTFIKFPSQMQESPTLFVGKDRSTQLVNYRVEGNYYIVDSVISDAQLHSGQRDTVVIQISRKR